MAYEVYFNIRGAILIDAANEKEAREKFFNSDVTFTEDLIKSLEMNIGDMGNDAITITDIDEIDCPGKDGFGCICGLCYKEVDNE